MKLSKVQFNSMAFQERNGTCGMKLECFGQNLAEKSGTDRDLKWDEICSVLFRFLNWYGMFRPFQAERNGIDNLDLDWRLMLCHRSSEKKINIKLERSQLEILSSLIKYKLQMNLSMKTCHWERFLLEILVISVIKSVK